MFTALPNGRAITIHIFYPKACFSLLQFVSVLVPKYDYVALQASTARQIPLQDFQDFLQHDSTTCFYFFERMLRGTLGLMKRIESLQSLSALEQVASLLLYFARHFGEKRSFAEMGFKELTSFIVTHQELANWLGLSRENTSIQMKKLEKMQLIDRAGKYVVITNMEQLRELATI
jgi:CRP/FNR family transcriptional regulator